MIGCYTNEWNDGLLGCYNNKWNDKVCTFIYNMSQRQLISNETNFDGICYCKEDEKYMSMDKICQYIGILIFMMQTLVGWM